MNKGKSIKKGRITQQLRVNEELYKKTLKKLIDVNYKSTFADLFEILLKNWLKDDIKTIEDNSDINKELLLLNVLDKNIRMQGRKKTYDSFVKNYKAIKVLINKYLSDPNLTAEQKTEFLLIQQNKLTDLLDFDFRDINNNNKIMSTFNEAKELLNYFNCSDIESIQNLCNYKKYEKGYLFHLLTKYTNEETAKSIMKRHISSYRGFK